MIDLDDIVFRYGPTPDGGFELRVPTLRVATGDRCALIGPSGSGKTTLLHLIAGIALPERGRIVVDGVDVASHGDAERRRFRIERLGLVFQEFALLEHLSVLDNVLLPFRIHPALSLDTAARERAATLLERVGLADRAQRLVPRLSQGERQRVAVCRALVTEPHLLLADEPTANLDPDNKFRVLDLLIDDAAARDATLLAVTHDHDLLDRFERTIDFRELASPEAEAGEANAEARTP